MISEDREVIDEYMRQMEQQTYLLQQIVNQQETLIEQNAKISAVMNQIVDRILQR